MASLLRRIFKRKKQPPLVCAVALDDATGEPLIDSPSHVHTSACFISFEPLAIVELFQSQGCQSCPPALPYIQEATQHPNLLLLTEDVTLFDHLGWKDTFAASWADQRHRAYAKIWERNQLFTPQVVVNGCLDGGSTGLKGKDEVEALVRQGRQKLAEAIDFHILLDANDSEIRIDSDKLEGTASPHDIYVAVYQSLDQTVKPAKGPNKGKKMNHRNVVMSMNKLAVWTGGNLTVPLPMSRHEMRAGTDAVAFVQSGPGGPIIAATKI